MTCHDDRELFFDPTREAEAVQVCSGCPLADACRERGQQEVYGVWGGSTPMRRAGQRFQQTTPGTRARDEAFAVILEVAEEYGLSQPGPIAVAAGLGWRAVANRMGVEWEGTLDSEVIRLRAEGLSLRETAIKLGVTKNVVSGVSARLRAHGKIKTAA